MDGDLNDPIFVGSYWINTSLLVLKNDNIVEYWPITVFFYFKSNNRYLLLNQSYTTNFIESSFLSKL
jgi:hypothetical protein